jgi:hypothetical protein
MPEIRPLVLRALNPNSKPATPNQFGNRRVDAKCPGRDSEIWTTERFPRLTQNRQCTHLSAFGHEVQVVNLRIARLDAHRRRALGMVAFSSLFLLGIALAREFIGQLEHLESS